MPSATERIQTLREQTEEGDIPYYSKSRVKSYKTCPRSFYHTYIEGKRGEETFAMKQGTRIHEVFEDYYDNIIEHFDRREGEEVPDFPPTPRQLAEFLPEPVTRWADWREFMANFLVWEVRRAEAAMSVAWEKEDAIFAWLPVGIEAEAWLENDPEPPWMGFADVIVSAATVPEVETNDGVVIVDFKTGKTPKKQYRDGGIYLEGEYYGMIFENEYQVAGVAGYYPKAGDFIVSDLSAERREEVRRIINEINELTDGEPVKEDFEIDEQPLCKWGTGDDEQCDFYDECPSAWGVPAEKEDLFKTMVDNGNTAYQIADYMDCPVNVVYYWARKMKLDL